MEYKPLPVGVDNFEMLVTRGYYFIDKTMFIKDLIDQKGLVNLFTRPRRFGKTLNLSMLQYFFEDARDRQGNQVDNRFLFDGLNIMRQGGEYVSYMQQYPVISLSFQSGKQPGFQAAWRAVRNEVAQEYIRHFYICQGDALLPLEKERFFRFMEQTGTQDEYGQSIRFLSQCMEKYYGKKAVLLVDEYDVPLENAFARGFYTEMADAVRALFEPALKANGSLEFAVLTGCLRISKESIFTGMNNLEIFSILNKNYDEYFGFTENEVYQMCVDYQLEQRFDTVKEWYNGYVFGNVNVYNPWSVVRFMKDLKADGDGIPYPYWANTSANTIVRKLIELADEKVKGEVEMVVGGGVLVKAVHEDITYDEVFETMDNLFNFMFFTGYFRKTRDWIDGNDIHYVELKIPNKEVKYIFRTKILTWFHEKIKQEDRTNLFQAVLDGDAATMEEEITKLLLASISFYDAYESFYHGFLVGILSGMEGYIVKSNREGGHGRSDLFIKPITRRKAAFIVEFKLAKSIRDMEVKAWGAIRQINDRKYACELEEDGYRAVHKYGVSFFGKDCHVVFEE